jgi:Zn-finger nucleic acid-binding protein
MFAQCPVDGTQLEMTERQGVEIDYCPKCRGVWLDRGELDKIVERSASFSRGGRALDDDDLREGRRRERREGRGYHGYGGREWRGRDDDDDDDDDGRRRRRRKSFLDDLFDF